MTTTTTVTCTCGTEIEAEGKVIHFCAQRYKGKVVSREHVGFFDGRPICHKTFSATSAIECQVELDAYVYELLQDTAAETADMEADAAGVQIEPVCGCGAPATVVVYCRGEHPCCDKCYQRQFEDNHEEWRGWEVEPIHAIDPELPSIFRPVPAPALLAEVDTLLASASLDDLWRTSGIEWEQRSARIRANVMARIAAPTCRNCGAGHTIQTCPEVRALLFAPVVARVLEQAA